MNSNEFKKTLVGSLSKFKDDCHNKNLAVSDTELVQISTSLKQFSNHLLLFSKHADVSDCELIINELRDIIKVLSVDVNCGEHELQAETHGVQVVTQEDMPLVKEYAYRVALMRGLEEALKVVCEEHPELTSRAP